MRLPFGNNKQQSPSPSIDHEKFQHGGEVAERDDDLLVACPSHTTERRLMQKIDLHVMPFLCVLYLLAFLDRVNISNASVYGLNNDLNLRGDQYNVALLIFFVPYILLEIPSNILLKKFKPNVWLSLNMFLFGFVTIMQGLVTSYGGLLTARFFLGVFETGMFPGCFYLIGMWYRRHEAQKRYSFFFSSTTLAGAFGGLIAAGIYNLNGRAGYAAWRWIFIIEGAITVGVALIFFFVLPTFPEQSKWLRDDEKAYVSARLRQDQGKSGVERPIRGKDVMHVFKDKKVIIAGFMYLTTVPAYSYAFFAPGIIKGYGYSPIQTQFHSVPPWAAAFGWSMFIATISDCAKHRFAFILVSLCVSTIGFAILISINNNTSLQYAALFLVTSGTYGAMPIIVCWFNMNLGGHHRRAIGSAWQIGFGNIGGIIATFSFTSSGFPRYIAGYSICISFTLLSLLASFCYGALCWQENRQKDRSTVDLNLTEQEKIELGDKGPDYRYQL